MKYLYAYLVALVIFLALDFAWLGFIAKNFYASRIGEMMLAQPRWAVAGVFYLLYVVGLVWFAISAGLNAGSVGTGALNGALFGFFTYLTYNATNLSVFKGYDPVVAVVDTAWGTLVGLIVSSATVAILLRFYPANPG